MAPLVRITRESEVRGKAKMAKTNQDQPGPRIVEFLQTHSDAYLRHTPRGCAGPLNEG